MFDIVRGCLGCHKICAQWVPKELTPEHLHSRFGTSLEFLIRYNEGGYNFLGRFVTCDETWIHYNNPESKQDSMQWKHTTSPRVRKFNQSLSVKRNDGVCLLGFAEA